MITNGLNSFSRQILMPINVLKGSLFLSDFILKTNQPNQTLPTEYQMVKE